MSEQYICIIGCVLEQISTHVDLILRNSIKLCSLFQQIIRPCFITLCIMISDLNLKESLNDK